MTRGLSSRAHFERDETRRDWKAIPELVGLGQEYFFMVPLLGKIREIIFFHLGSVREFPNAS